MLCPLRVEGEVMGFGICIKGSSPLRREAMQSGTVRKDFP